MTITAVVPAGRGFRIPAPASTGRPPTPITRKAYRETFTAPVSNPGGTTQRQMWAAASRCGLWHYARQDDGLGTLWTVTYLPTGQTREGYGTSRAARLDTAAKLVDELRGEAFTAALRGPVEGRRDGQRWLAVHMRLAGADEADFRCQCGGLLVRATRGGDLAHVDGCRECYEHGAGFVIDGCAQSSRICMHRFCAAPAPVECSHWLDRPRACGELAVPNAGAGCGLGRSGDCCTACCNGG